ncbi:MAG: CoA pyrophosphatase [Syntrophomonadaceae bacterium]|nr:CoA pyrophosphatase [Syntrophomonadaceae bacterium]MDD4548793.1 CoA pyrophosphatase [Syntrophomonadaceae bacterium]
MLENKIATLQGRQPDILDHEKSSRSAVLLPLVKIASELYVLFEKRSYKLDFQPGEICFPGGGIEEFDGNPTNAAIRETCEELGVKPEQIEVVTPLDIMVSPFNTIVYPYLAYIHNCQHIRINPAEVENFFYVPLSYLLEHKPLYKTIPITPSIPADFPVELIPQGANYPFRHGSLPQYFYFWQDEVIWGLTARILHHFINLL